MNVTKGFPTATVVTTVAAVLAFLALLAFPNATIDASVDASWSGAFAYFFQHRLHAGTDYIFTYGPLGFLLTAYFDPYTFPIKWIYEVALKAYIITEIIRITRLTHQNGKTPDWLYPLLPLGVLALTFAFSVHPATTYTSDAFAYITVLVLATVAARDTNLSLIRILLTFLIVAILSLAKATLLILAIPVVLLCAGRVAAQKTRLVAGIFPLLLFPLLWIAFWLLLGQSFTNILPYFTGAFSVATGYNEAMAYHRPVYRDGPIPLVAAVITLISLLLTVGLQINRVRKADRERWLSAIYLIATVMILMIAWKHGFTRGYDHTKIFFLFAAFAASFLAVVLPRSRATTGLALLATLCAIFGVLRGNDGWFHRTKTLPPLVSALPPLLNPVGTWTKYQTLLNQNRTGGQLPLIRSIVGMASVDMWSYDQGILLLNDLHYQPHPSLQGYNSYTRYLQERDLDFYASDAAPEYLVFKADTVDQRYPTLDGGPAFTALLLRYVPVCVEKGYILMQRRTPTISIAQLAVIRDAAPVRTVVSQEPISVPPAPPGCVQMVSIELTPTPLGIARRLLYKSADVFIGVRVTGMQNTAVRRLIPTMAAQGFVLSPVLDEQDHVLAFYSGKPLPVIERFAIGIPPESLSCFQHQIKVRLYTVPIQANDSPTKTVSSGRQHGNISD